MLQTVATPGNQQILQVFAPTTLVAVTAATPWQPTAGQLAFRVPVACTYKLNGSTEDASLAANQATGIDDSLPSFTFDTDMTIEVM